MGLGVVAVLVGSLPGLPRQTAQGLDLSSLAVSEGVARQASARGSTGYLVRAAQPRTALSSQSAATNATPDAAPAGQAAPAAAAPASVRHGVLTYAVQPGDTVFGLAERFGISAETILAANITLAGNPDLLSLGQEILIPPVSGTIHVVSAGDTLVAIAQRYQVTVDAIVGYKDNNIADANSLQLGQKLVIPGGKMPAPSAARASAPASASSAAPAAANPAYRATGRFVWPTTGVITQSPWARHMAVDIGAPMGTPIYASDSGYVMEAGWSNVGYGQYVMIDHGNGLRSLYAHMSVIIAKRGQWVQQGQRIGLVGSTGNSTGPHLHFEIYRNGVIQNPLNYLP